jgi:hypothetical protein
VVDSDWQKKLLLEQIRELVQYAECGLSEWNKGRDGLFAEEIKQLQAVRESIRDKDKVKILFPNLMDK